MNNQEFDNMIRARVGNTAITPSEQVGKSLGKKMFYKNIWFFHKTKAFLILFLLGTISFPLWNELNFDTELNPQIASNSNEEQFTPNNNQNQYSKEILGKNTEKANQEEDNSSIDIIKKESLEEERKTVLFNKNKPVEVHLKNKASKSNKADKVKAIKNTNYNRIASDNFKKTKTLKNKNELLAPNTGTYSSNELSYITLSQKAFPLKSNLDKSIVDFSFDYKNQEVDYVKYKGIFSIDVYATPFNQLNIKNELNENELSNDYEKKEWDFYRNEGIVNSGFAGGVRVNYNWKNILISGGIKLSSLRDYKPMYKYENVQDEEVLEYFDLEEVSGVQIQDKDSAHYVFYTENNEELINKLENEKFNTYKYLSIPLRIGYEFKQEKYSIAVQGGGIYSRLLSAKGSYLRKYNNLEKLDVYYNRGIEASKLENENSMLKKNHFSFVAAIIANVNIANSFDIFGELNYTKGLNNITKKTISSIKTYRQ